MRLRDKSASDHGRVEMHRRRCRQLGGMLNVQAKWDWILCVSAAERSLAMLRLPMRRWHQGKSRPLWVPRSCCWTADRRFPQGRE